MESTAVIIILVGNKVLKGRRILLNLYVLVFFEISDE